MVKLQLWSVDEYGQGSILKDSTNLQDLVKEAKKQVHEANFENAMAFDEQDRNWEYVFIEVYDKDTQELVEDAAYAGKSTTGHHCILQLDGDSAQIHKLDECDVDLRFYLGNRSKTPQYFLDARSKKYVTDIRNIDFIGRTVLFIRTVSQPKV